MKKMGKILPVEAVVGAAMLKNKGWLRGRICFENEVVYTDLGPETFWPSWGISTCKIYWPVKVCLHPLFVSELQYISATKNYTPNKTSCRLLAMWPEDQC